MSTTHPLSSAWRLVSRRHLVRWLAAAALALLAAPAGAAPTAATTRPAATEAETRKSSAAPDTPEPTRTSSAATEAETGETIRLVVPFAAGGPTDAVARALAPALARALGAPVEVEHLPGAGGTRGALAVAQARPDGRTLLLHHVGMATAPALYRALPYRPQRDFVALGGVVDMPMTLVVRRDFPGRNEADTIWLLRRPHASWLVAYAGLGAASHLCGLLLSEALGVDLIQIPYQGTGPAMRDLRAGDVDLMCDQIINTLAPITAGEVRPVAVTSAQPLPGLVGVPTTEQVGLSGLNLSIWHGLYLPAGASDEVVRRHVRALAAARADPAFAKAMAAVDAVVPSAATASPQAFRRLLASETKRWATLIRRNGQLAD